MIGVFSELVGRSAEIMVRKTAKDRKTVTEKDIFSPASTGITKTRMFRNPKNTTGRIIFMT
jgi:hypothetical protein